MVFLFRRSLNCAETGDPGEVMFGGPKQRVGLSVLWVHNTVCGLHMVRPQGIESFVHTSGVDSSTSILPNPDEGFVCRKHGTNRASE